MLRNMETDNSDDYCVLNTSEKCSVNENLEDSESLSIFSIPASPALTEKSSVSALLSEHGRKNLKVLESQSAKSSASCVTMSSKSFSSAKGGTEYRTNHININPITGEITETIAKCCPYVTSEEKNAGFEVDCRDISKKISGSNRYASEILNSTYLKKSYIRRNPITGEGMPDSNYPINMKNVLRGGQRTRQPPGGLSSGIF